MLCTILSADFRVPFQICEPRDGCLTYWPCYIGTCIDKSRSSRTVVCSTSSEITSVDASHVGNYRRHKPCPIWHAMCYGVRRCCPQMHPAPLYNIQLLGHRLWKHLSHPFLKWQQGSTPDIRSIATHSETCDTLGNVR